MNIRIRTRLLTAMAITAILTHPQRINAANWGLIRRLAQSGACVASATDIYTTTRAGLVETNPVLGVGAPNVARLYGLKLGVCGATFIVSELVARHHPGTAHVTTEKMETLGAVGQMGYFGGFAVHNALIKVNTGTGK